MAIHSTILAWRIPWTEKPGGIQSMESQRVGHDFVTKQPQQHEETCSKSILSLSEDSDSDPSLPDPSPPAHFVIPSLQKIEVLV